VLMKNRKELTDDLRCLDGFRSEGSGIALCLDRCLIEAITARIGSNLTSETNRN
jgi:hypothetical protein